MIVIAIGSARPNVTASRGSLALHSKQKYTKPMHILQDIRHSKWFDTVYKIGIGIKGIDGLIELLVGVVLIFSPRTPHHVLQHAAEAVARHHGSFFQWLTHAVIKLDTDLNGQAVTLLILFLITHGAIKLILVYCLLRRFYHAYPYALVALVVLLILQVIPIFHDPGSVGLWLFAILDVIIIYLVWAEYLDLREKVKKEAATKHTEA